MGDEIVSVHQGSFFGVSESPKTDTALESHFQKKRRVLHRAIVGFLPRLSCHKFKVILCETSRPQFSVVKLDQVLERPRASDARYDAWFVTRCRIVPVVYYLHSIPDVQCHTTASWHSRKLHPLAIP